MRRMPMCQKCREAIIATERVFDEDFTILTGCKLDATIESWGDAQRQCPLIQEKTDGDSVSV